MCRMWTNFAKFGNPTPDDDNLTKWNKVENSPTNKEEIYQNCLCIDEKIVLQENPERKRLEFWKGIYNKWNSNFFKAKL